MTPTRSDLAVNMNLLILTGLKMVLLGSVVNYEEILVTTRRSH